MYSFSGLTCDCLFWLFVSQISKTLWVDFAKLPEKIDCFGRLG